MADDLKKILEREGDYTDTAALINAVFDLREQVKDLKKHIQSIESRLESHEEYVMEQIERGL